MLKNWVLRMFDGKEYQMTEAQISLIDQTVNAGGGFVRFDDLAINTKAVERYWKPKEIEAYPHHREDVEMSEEQKKANLDRVREMIRKKGLNV